MAEITLTAKWQTHKIVVGLQFVISEEDWVITQSIPADVIILPTPSCAVSFCLEWLDSNHVPIPADQIAANGRGQYNAKFVEVIDRNDNTSVIVDGFQLDTIQGYQRVNQDGLGLAVDGVALHLSGISPPITDPPAASALIRVKALP